MLNGTQIRTYPLREQGQRDIALAWRQGTARSEAFELLGNVIKHCCLTHSANCNVLLTDDKSEVKSCSTETL